MPSKIKKWLATVLRLDGCCWNHHFEKDDELREYRISRYGTGANFKIEVKTEYGCVHENCNKTEERWDTYNTVPERIDDGCNRRFRKKLKQVLEYPK